MFNIISLKRKLRIAWDDRNCIRGKHLIHYTGVTGYTKRGNCGNCGYKELVTVEECGNLYLHKYYKKNGDLKKNGNVV